MKPNPEETMKVLLWNLACLRTEVNEVNTKLDMLCEKQGITLDVSPTMKKTLSDIQKSVFLSALHQVGIEPGEGWPPDETGSFSP